MLKGKSTIELFDGVTGKKKDEHINENLVTNAIANMFDLRNELPARGVDLTSILSRITPLYPTYLRGILLWDNTLPNNPDIIIPPPGIKCIGHAGSTYAGTNPLRGTFNENESEVNGNSIRMVWDFATDKVDATIRSVSLTSILGGDRGWMTPWESGTLFRSRVNGGSQSTSTIQYATTSVNTLGATYVYMGELRRGVQYYVADRNDSSITILEQTYVSPESIGIFNTVGTLSNNQPHCTETLYSVASSARFTNLGSCSIIDGNGNLVHVALTGTGGRNARIRTVNLITRSIISDRTITLSEDVRTDAAAFFKGKLYASSTARNSICEFGDNGLFIRSFNTGFTTNNRYTCYGEYLFSSASSGNSLMTDGTNYIVTQAGHDNGTNAAALMNTAGLKPPLCVVLTESSPGNTKQISYLTPFMATINNLSAPVVKNSLNTMKVTYELVQE
ncbi:MAG: hypothetical protein FWE74_10960 [Oscillospiraceae bacterium]|nr:hypothetical protein [Oscillospiraceae bacterium]